MSMTIDDVHRILVVGAGMMGRQIALQCAMHDYEVTLYDSRPDALVQAREQLEAFAAELTSQGRLTDEARAAVLSRIVTESDKERAASDADLLSESVPENPAVKWQVFMELGRLCPPRTVFTTNTSTLLPSMFAGATGRPERFAALHFHPVVWDANVVDVMPHPGTDPRIVGLLKSFARRIGQVPIVLKKESHNYVYNAMLAAVFDVAMSLVMDDVVSPDDVDRAWMGITKMRAGPFGQMDYVGLDVVWGALDFWAKTVGSPQIKARADFLKQHIDKGGLGVKSGTGFYTYPDAAFLNPEFLNPHADSEGS